MELLGSTELNVHSIINGGNVLIHNIQSTNLARLKQVRRLLMHVGYDVANDIRSEGGYHSVILWSLENITYNQVPKSTHKAILKLLGISLNNLDAYPHIISTHATVRFSRTRRRARHLSPSRLQW